MNTDKKTLVVALLSLIVMAGCARREENESTVPSGNEVIDTVAEAEKHVPKATIAAVKAHVTLSPQAEAELKEKSEKVMVVATYSGDPISTEQAQQMADSSGMIKLGENTQLLDGAGTVTFEDDVIEKSRLAFIVGEVQLTLNVTSSKTSTSDNLLACPFYWKTLAEASQENVQIACKALSEVQE